MEKDVDVTKEADINIIHNNVIRARTKDGLMNKVIPDNRQHMVKVALN